MLSDSGHELQTQKSLQIKQDDKFFSRLMSKETSMANSSCRVYYGGASGAVPFMWESQPGTPKHPSSDTTLPPLTPPPSYYSSYKSKSLQKRSLKPTLFTSIFRSSTQSRKKNHASPSSSRSSTSSSSSSWSSLHGSSSPSSSSASSRNSKFHRRNSYFSCSRSPIIHSCNIMDDEDDDDNHEEGLGSPNSTLCFGVKRRNLNHEFVRGYCQSMVNMKKALLSIVSHADSGHQGNKTA